MFGSPSTRTSRAARVATSRVSPTREGIGKPGRPRTGRWWPCRPEPSTHRTRRSTRTVHLGADSSASQGNGRSPIPQFYSPDFLDLPNTSVSRILRCRTDGLFLARGPGLLRDRELRGEMSERASVLDDQAAAHQAGERLGSSLLAAPLIAGDATLIASASRRRSQSPRFMTCTSRANTYAVVRKSPGKQSAKR